MFQKDYTSRGIVSNTFFSVLSKIIPIIISIICIPIIINKLGDAKYGTLTIALAFIGYFNLFDLGLGKAITKLISERIGQGLNHEIKDIFKTGVILTSALGAFGGLLFFLVSEPITVHYLKPPEDFIEEVLSGLTYLSIGIPFAILINSFRGLLEALHEFKKITLIQIIMGLATYSGIIALLFFTLNLKILIGYLSLMKIVHFVVYSIISTIKLREIETKSSFKITHMKKLFGFGGWVTVSTVVGPLMTIFDRLVIGSKEGMESVAYYSTSSEIINRVGVLPNAIVAVLFPVFSRNKEIEMHKNHKVYTSSFEFLLLMGSFFIMIFIGLGYEILSVWINNGFALKSFFILQILSVGALFNYIARVPSIFIQGMGRPDITAKFHVLELFVYLYLLFVLINLYGIVGAALAACIRMIMDFIFLHFYSVVKFKTTLELKSLLLGAIIPILFSYYISAIEIGFLQKLGMLLAGFFTIALFFWFNIFEKEFKEKVMQLARLDK